MSILVLPLVLRCLDRDVELFEEFEAVDEVGGVGAGFVGFEDETEYVGEDLFVLAADACGGEPDAVGKCGRAEVDFDEGADDEFVDLADDVAEECGFHEEEGVGVLLSGGVRADGAVLGE